MDGGRQLLRKRKSHYLIHESGEGKKGTDHVLRQTGFHPVSKCFRLNLHKVCVPDFGKSTLEAVTLRFRITDNKYAAPAFASLYGQFSGYI
ncbi:hypothetical protein AVEN_267610-1 [Araneus ventricosus]|uniref:Uncharacterized protein n=1 Tax=Araneus ventricosus TaxID=182803 RepID=A0A4Y2XC09_ARAVE|nr:hypothetical protein AVEN_267610-1 [Araneus ventricosus]